MKALAKAVTKKVAVKDMNPVTVLVRAATKANAAMQDSCREAALIMAADKTDGEKTGDAHTRLMKRAKAIVHADGETATNYVWDTLSSYLMLALEPELMIETKAATDKKAAVLEPASQVINTIAARNLPKAARQVRDANGIAKTRKTKAPKTPAPTKAKAESSIKGTVKHWLAHAAEKRQLEAALAELGYSLTKTRTTAQAATRDDEAEGIPIPPKAKPRARATQ